MSQVLGKKAQFKTPAEMKTIQEADALLKQQQAATFTPEKNAYKALGYIEYGRYVKGPSIGLFVAYQLITEDAQGRPLKKPIKKQIAEGVDLVVLLSSMETAIRARVYK